MSRGLLFGVVNLAPLTKEPLIFTNSLFEQPPDSLLQAETSQMQIGRKLFPIGVDGYNRAASIDLDRYSRRFIIEETIKDLKEVCGLSRQEVCNWSGCKARAVTTALSFAAVEIVA